MKLTIHYPFMYFPQTVTTKASTSQVISKFISSKLDTMETNLRLNYDGDNKTAQILVKKEDGSLLTRLFFKYGLCGWEYSYSKAE